MIKKAFFIWIVLQYPAWLSAQAVLVDTTFISRAELNVHAIYADRMVDQIHLYEGANYIPYQSRNDQHPYFNVDWSVGNIFYNGSLYSNQEILYNTFNDQVIIQDYYGANFIQLAPGKIDYFMVEGHTFVRITEPPMKPGFYDLLVDDTIKLYTRRSKEFKETVSSNEVIHEFREINKYYLFRNNSYYPIKNKRSMKLVLSDFENEVNQFIRAQHLQFRSDFEESLIKITQFCNEL